jgi:thiamine pyrophosphokinase
MGDFDSLSVDIYQEICRAGVELLTFPIAKDQTDIELAIDLSLARGGTKIRIIGGLGARLDHTLGNIGLLLKAYQKGVPAFLVDSRQEATVTGSHIQIPSKVGMGVSLIPLTPKVSGVTTTGLKFPLNNADLYFHQTLGIHNECIGKAVEISLKEGILLIITFQEDNPVN